MSLLEILSPATQAKALRLLQQQQFERLGGNTTIETNVRIIAATNKDLEAAVAQGQFRQDLYYRLSGFTLRLPPLRDRRDDIPLLARYFVKVLCAEMGRSVCQIADETLTLLGRHNWPGNVRELFSAVRFAVVNTAGDLLLPDALPGSCRGESDGASPSPSPAPTSPAISAADPLPDVRQLTKSLLADASPDLYRRILQAVERVMFEEVLAETHGNQLQAAERLGISRMTLRTKLKATRDHDSPDES